MVQQTQLRRGTTAENEAFTGALGEVTVDTDLQTLRLHDGSTAGGVILKREGLGTLGVTDFWEETHFLSGASSSNACWTNTAIDSGTSQAPLAASQNGGHHGQTRMRCAAGSNSGSRWQSSVNAFRLGSTTPLLFRAVVFFHNLASTETVRVGFYTSTDHSDGAQAVCMVATNGALVGRTVKDSSANSTGSSFTLSMTTWYTLEIEIAANGASATFRVLDDDGELLWDDVLAVTIPVDDDEPVGCGITATSTVGSTTDIVTLDYLGVGTVAGYERARSV